MPKNGDNYCVTLKEAHLKWGTHRKTSSRPPISDESYIPIPKEYAEGLGIYNSNKNPNGEDLLGVNIFNWVSSCGAFNGTLKAGGCSSAGDTYAKQFNERGNLKGLAPFLTANSAAVGDTVCVQWVSPTDIVIKIIKP